MGYNVSLSSFPASKSTYDPLLVTLVLTLHSQNRQQSTSKVAIPSLRFSPIANHLAWTDVEGSLIRWADPIPSSHTSPVKEIDVTANSKSANGQSKSTINYDDLFDDIGDEVADRVGLEDEYRDDWIIDDELGEGYKKDMLGPIDHGPRGLREMGELLILRSPIHYRIMSLTLS